ncbi:MAG: T9SS type A sorting domain-containing protein [Chitinophagaceae bacterium]|nr:T9SS type A sorting domain-containing protein [Chitinophagaceae bacterium]
MVAASCRKKPVNATVEWSINVSSLASGVYLLEYKKGGGSVIKKFVKE